MKTKFVLLSVFALVLSCLAGYWVGNRDKKKFANYVLAEEMLNHHGFDGALVGSVYYSNKKGRPLTAETNLERWGILLLSSLIKQGIALDYLEKCGLAVPEDRKDNLRKLNHIAKQWRLLEKVPQPMPGTAPAQYGNGHPLAVGKMSDHDRLMAIFSKYGDEPLSEDSLKNE